MIVPASAMGHQDVLALVRTRLPRRPRRQLAMDGFRPAAVAVMLFDGSPQTWVTLTRRSPTLRAHAGQISFPGGVRDLGDPTLAHTALRESHEELGVAPALQAVLGALDDQPTPTGFIITPVITELSARPRYLPNPHEVAEIVEMPLSAFADPDQAEDAGTQEIHGQRYALRTYRYGSYRVTGATARILEQLILLIR